MSRKVFLSYSSMDSDLADQICRILDEVKIEYFRDEKDIDWGDELTHEIHSALEEISAVVVVISPASLKSHWVSYEIGYARALGKVILPFLEHPSLEAPPFIRNLRYMSSLDRIKKFFLESTFDTATMTAPVIQTSSIHTDFNKANQLIPELLKEMRDDIKADESRLVREFFVLPTRGLALNSTEPRFAYYETDHENLRGKIKLLEEYGFVRDVTPGNTPIYRFREEFIELLLQIP